MPRKKSASKRANNEGSVYQNKNGLWIAQATIGYNENGKQIRKAVSGKTRSEAIANLAPYLPKNGARKQLIWQDMPMKSHMQFWMMKYKKRTIAPRTFERYIGNAKRYIYPYMGGYLPQNITTNLLQDFLGGMLVSCGTSLCKVPVGRAMRPPPAGIMWYLCTVYNLLMQDSV